MKTAFLIYRPVMDYEDSIEPHFICLTRHEADNRVARMVKFAEGLAKRMPKLQSSNRS